MQLLIHAVFVKGALDGQYNAEDNVLLMLGVYLPYNLTENPMSMAMKAHASSPETGVVKIEYNSITDITALSFYVASKMQDLCMRYTIDRRYV